MHQVFGAYMKGLDDYTMDERGDVGSWIRMASIRGLCMIIELLFDIGSNFEAFGSLDVWLPPSTYHEALGGILKQGVERLDNVRRQAGESFLKLLRKEPPTVQESEKWRIHGRPLMEQLFLKYVTCYATLTFVMTFLFRSEADVGWNEGQWLFPKAVRMLEVEMYRLPILRGLTFSVGSRTDSTVSLPNSIDTDILINTICSNVPLLCVLEHT